MSDATVLCRLDELEDGGVRKFDLAGRELAVVRIEDQVYVLADRCSHQDVSLSEGEVDVDDCTLECPKHGAAFSLETGEPLALPAVRPVARYEVTIHDGEVSVVIGS